MIQVPYISHTCMAVFVLYVSRRLVLAGIPLSFQYQLYETPCPPLAHVWRGDDDDVGSSFVFMETGIQAETYRCKVIFWYTLPETFSKDSLAQRD